MTPVGTRSVRTQLAMCCNYSQLYKPLLYVAVRAGGRDPVLIKMSALHHD